MVFMEQVLLVLVHMLQSEVMHIQGLCDFMKNEISRLNTRNDAAEARIAAIVAAKEAADAEVASLRVRLAYMDKQLEDRMDWS